MSLPLTLKTEKMMKLVPSTPFFITLNLRKAIFLLLLQFM